MDEITFTIICLVVIGIATLVVNIVLAVQSFQGRRGSIDERWFVFAMFALFIVILIIGTIGGILSQTIQMR